MSIGVFGNIVVINRSLFDAVSSGGYWSDETRNDCLVSNINWLKRNKDDTNIR